MTKTWAVLHDRNARLYLTGVLVSGFGTSALWLVSGVWVKDLTGSDGLAALCMLAMWAPTLAGPLLGTIADRLRRKPLLIGGNLLLAALLPVLLTERAAVILTVLFVYGAVGVVQDAAESALVAGAVAPALLGDFNGLRTALTEGMKLVAPLAGAGLYALYGGPAVALLDAATFVLAALLSCALRVRKDGPAPSRRTPFVEGARHLWAHPTLRPLIMAAGTTMLLAGLNGALLYAVIDGLGHSPAYAGALYAVQGAGSVAVGMVSGPALRRLGERRFAAYGIALTAVAAGLRAVPSDPLALACSAAVGAGLPCVLIAALTAVQRETPNALLGRTVATANTLVYTPNVLGLAAGAALVELVAQRPLSAVLGAVWLAAAVQKYQRPASAEKNRLQVAVRRQPGVIQPDFAHKRTPSRGPVRGERARAAAHRRDDGGSWRRRPRPNGPGRRA
ncbi:integral membrane efflux protein [Streptomyces sviceus ATCC 29083]|uniref:Integral membrane efflux protein n=1 Tax=Streptomyces sviceus (strain ATCC 29083 / DSM 924 / JCM 4929 / NBRC 13980 / NCIMB 11184 / NRRL 5439 / UC 5370) TaxID=463191 RepID=B5HR36_STRX2|nr:integral membrane efflux protein [Streptomyces sviceus ATCC 29083]